MVKVFDRVLKENRACSHLEAARLLESSGLFEQAAAMHWISIRMQIFAWLELRDFQYESTRDALLTIMRASALKAIHADLTFIHLVGTLAEWDESFTITKLQMDIFSRKCEDVRSKLLEEDGEQIAV